MMIIDRFGYKLDLVDKRGSYFLFLISYFLFLISYFLFLISYFLFLISYFLFTLKIIEHYFRIDLELLLFDSLLFRR